MATMEQSISNGGAPPPTLIAPAPAVKRRTSSTMSQGPPKKRKLTPEKAKEIRLAQNRKAARESRKRKKSMIEELQRSVVFFSKSNNSLKQQNEELTRQLMDAKAKVAKLYQQREQNRNGAGADNGTVTVVPPSSSEPVVKVEGIAAPTTATATVKPQHTTTVKPQHDNSEVLAEQQQFQVSSKTNSSKEATSEQGANTNNSNALELLSSSAVASPAQPPQPVLVALQRTLPLMQPGATMEEMAKFQQATAAAIQAAAQCMVGSTSFHASAMPSAAATIMNPLNNGNNEKIKGQWN